MPTKKFTSINNWFSLTIPVTWEEYDDGNEGTYAFFNPERKWTGNLRITPLRNSISSGDMVASLLSRELKDRTGARKTKIGNMDAITYKIETKEEGEQLVVYYWKTGKNNIAFICSFTMEKRYEGSAEMNEELEIIETILSSIQINS